ncbi:MAG: rhodanese-like domain-containing protein [Nocardioidaceae bacterium]
MNPMPVPTAKIDQVPTELPETLVLLDVREPSEWSAGHATQARHIPLGELQDRIAEVPADRQVLVVCHSGGRSARATAFLRTQGVEAINLEGGMLAWEHAQRPMVSETDAPPQVL